MGGAVGDLPVETRAAPGDDWRELVRYVAAAAVPLALAVLAARLVLAPVHAVRSAAACGRAYAAARTHADTVTADLLTYADSAGGPARRRRRCGDLRTATVDLTRR
jgi:hypothetical protein